MIGEVLRRKWYIDLLASLVEPGPVKALEIWRDLEADYPPLLAANPTADESAWRRVANGFTATLSDRSLAHRVSASQIGTALLVNTKVRDRLREEREAALLNAALFRYRQREGKDPETIAEILPEGVRKTTSEGPWDWRSDPDVAHRWIERGLLADIRAKEAESFKAMGKLLEGMGVIEEGTITEEDE